MLQLVVSINILFKMYMLISCNSIQKKQLKSSKIDNAIYDIALMSTLLYIVILNIKIFFCNNNVDLIYEIVNVFKYTVR